MTSASIFNVVTEAAKNNQPSPDDIEAFTFAVLSNDIRGIEVLLRIYGREIINKKDNQNQTALGLAAQHGYVSCLRVLLAHNPDLEVRGWQDRTALMNAASRGWESNAECITLLLSKGADINATDESGLTALDVAEKESCTRCIKALREWPEKQKARDIAIWHEGIAASVKVPPKIKLVSR